jgi:Mg-chelatase subunit ChlD
MISKVRGVARAFLALVLALGISSLQVYYSQTKVLDKQGRTQTDPDNLVVHVDLVNVLFTVADRKGKLVTDLEKANLKIFEDNKPQTITNFTRETELPLTIAILIDTSSSIRDRFKFEQEAAIDFLYRTLRPKKDKALLITFDSVIELVQDYTDNPEVLSKAIRQVRPGGGTKMFDAVFLACQEKLKAETGRKILILISDGDDNLSLETLEGSLEMAQKSDVTLYTISTTPAAFSVSRRPRPTRFSSDSLKTQAAEPFSRSKLKISQRAFKISASSCEASIPSPIVHRTPLVTVPSAPSRSKRTERTSKSNPVKATTLRGDEDRPLCRPRSGTRAL